MSNRNRNRNNATATATTTPAPAPEAKPLATQVQPEVQPVTLRPVSAIMAESFHYDGERGVLDGLATMDAESVAEVITALKGQSERAYAAQRWIVYDASKLPDAETRVPAILKSLVEKFKLSPTSGYQLKSEALTLCPILIANGVEKSVTLDALKNAKGGLKFGPDFKPLSLDQQPEAGKKLLPLLKDGTLRQTDAKSIRKEIPVAQGGTKKEEPAPTPATPADPEKAAALKDAVFMGWLSQADAYLNDNKAMEPDKALVILCSLARKFGKSVV